MNAKNVYRDCLEDLKADFYGLNKGEQPGACSDKVQNVYDIYK